jgi:hypothetical protein
LLHAYILVPGRKERCTRPISSAVKTLYSSPQSRKIPCARARSDVISATLARSVVKRLQREPGAIESQATCCACVPATRQLPTLLQSWLTSPAPRRKSRDPASRARTATGRARTVSVDQSPARSALPRGRRAPRLLLALPDLGSPRCTVTRQERLCFSASI